MPPGLQGFQASLDEREACFQASQVFKRAGRPAEVEVAEAVGDRVHIAFGKADPLLERLAIDQEVEEQLVTIVAVLAAGGPAECDLLRPIRRQYLAAAGGEDGRQLFETDAESKPRLPE